MRKILLASTALIAFAGAAQAAESPIQVTLGGSVDFQAALVQESTLDVASATSQRRGDFITDYEITIAAEGKSASGIEYGALINLDNDNARTAGNGNAAVMDMTYVWMSGAFGKVMLGDNHGASLLFVGAPTIGAGQYNGYFDDFTTATRTIAMEPTVFSDTEDYTKVTYFTPKVGNANHKVQLGVSFTPSTDAGSTATTYDATTGYKNIVELAAKYNGTFGSVNVVATPLVVIADGVGNKTTTGKRDYTVWGFGTQASYAGFTAGASYANGGHANTKTSETRHQDVWTFGLKYEFDKVELAANYMTGEGYFANRYVDSYNALGLGATYTWFPGMRTAADAVFFNQNRADQLTQYSSTKTALTQVTTTAVMC